MRYVRSRILTFLRIKAKVQHYTFDQLCKNNTEVLDALYNAEVLVIDISGMVSCNSFMYCLERNFCCALSSRGSREYKIYNEYCSSQCG